MVIFHSYVNVYQRVAEVRQDIHLKYLSIPSIEYGVSQSRCYFT